MGKFLFVLASILFATHALAMQFVFKKEWLDIKKGEFIDRAKGNNNYTALQLQLAKELNIAPEMALDMPLEKLKELHIDKTNNKKYSQRGYSMTPTGSGLDMLMQFLPMALISILAGLPVLFAAKAKGYKRPKDIFFCLCPLVNLFVLPYYIAAPDQVLRKALQKKEYYKKCPFCAEDILADAIYCKHCMKELA